MLNRVVLTGRLTRDAELRYTQGGTSVASFTLAVDRQFRNAQGERDADFINCVIWRKPAENFANFTHKGTLVGIDGSLRTRSYENNQGQRVYVTEVQVDNFALLEPRRNGGQPYSGGRSQSNFGNGQGNWNNNQSQYNGGGYQQGFDNGRASQPMGNSSFGNQGGFNNPFENAPMPGQETPVHNDFPFGNEDSQPAAPSNNDAATFDLNDSVLPTNGQPAADSTNASAAPKSNDTKSADSTAEDDLPF